MSEAHKARKESPGGTASPLPGDSGGSGSGRTPDPPPRAGGGKPRGGSGKTKRKDPVADVDLRKTLAKLLSLPAVPAKAFLHCDFCAQHFATEGPNAARELVTLAADHPDLRAALEDVHRYYTSVTWAGILLGYVAKPAAHHLMPNRVLVMARPILEVPPRDEPARTAGAPGEPPAGGDEPGMAPDTGAMSGMEDAAREVLKTMTPDQVASMYGISVEQAAQLYADLGVTPAGQNGVTPTPEAVAGYAGEGSLSDNAPYPPTASPFDTAGRSLEPDPEPPAAEPPPDPLAG